MSILQPDKYILPIDEYILPLYDDYVLKAILTHPDAKISLMDIITAAIDRTVANVKIRNNELPTMDTEEKTERLDVNCIIDNGDQVDVEMQGSRLEELTEGHTNFLNKTIYYLTDLHSSQKSKGVEYYDLVRTYQITFSMYTIFPGYTDYVTFASMRRSDGVLISDQINLVIIELSKLDAALKKPVEEMTSLEMWSIFLRYASDPQHRKLINEIITKKEALSVAAKVLTSISKDEHERAKFMSRRKFETDMYSNLMTAEKRGEIRGIAIGEERGIAIGEERGREEGLRETVQEMKKENFPDEVIARITKLTMEKIREYTQ